MAKAIARIVNVNSSRERVPATCRSNQGMTRLPPTTTISPSAIVISYAIESVRWDETTQKVLFRLPGRHGRESSFFNTMVAKRLFLFGVNIKKAGALSEQAVRAIANNIKTEVRFDKSSLVSV